MVRAVTLALLVLGCATPADSTAAPAADTAPADTAAAEVPEVSVEIPPPAWSAEEAAARISATFAQGIPEPVTVRAQIFALFENRDPACPGGVDYTLPGSFTGCLTKTGWRYAGVLTYGGPITPDVLDDFTVLADSYIISPDGEQFIGAGDLEYAVEDGDPVQWSGLISGQWSYPPASGWMRDDQGSAVLTMHATSSEGGWSVTLNGGIYLDGVALRLVDLSADSKACGGAPTGQLELRDPSGYAYTLDAECGCGTLRWADGSELGEVCVSAAEPLAALAAVGVP